MPHMKQPPIDAQLSAMPLFAGLKPRELSEVAGAITQRHVKEGKSVIKEGNWGHEFVLVLEGEIEIHRDGQLVDVTGPGSYVGELAVLDDVRRNADVIARTPVIVGTIEAGLFRSLLDEIPELEERIKAESVNRKPTTP
jgi:CRP-like cAMP-binding protein